MAIFDVEDYRDAVVDLLKANLNSEIACINAAKGDFLIEEIPAANYYNAQWEQDHNNYPYIFAAVMGAKPTTVGRGTSLDIDMKIGVEYANPEESTDRIERTILRYLRAMHIVFSKNFDNISSSNALEIREWSLYRAQVDQQMVISATTLITNSIVTGY